MDINLTWLGHATWEIEAAGQKILLDPFLNDSPVAPVKAADVDAHVILVSHGHFDHVADVAEIANRCNAHVVAVYEIAQWFQANHDVQSATGMNVGGTFQLPLDEVTASVKMTAAVHSSQLPDGSSGGVAAGFVLSIEGIKFYFACDTALFSDMQLIGQSEIDVAVVPIGDLFTMGIEDSAVATEFIKPTTVIPTHFNTWPPIEADTDRWQELIKAQTAAQPVVLKPGETFTVSRS